MLAGSQVASGTHAGIHLGPTDIGCQYSRSIYTTRLIVWQPRRAADTSTNWRQSFSFAASMEQTASTELKLLRSTDSFRRDLKTFLFDLVYGHQDTN